MKKSKYEIRNKIEMFVMYWHECVVKHHEEPSWTSYKSYCSGANIRAQAALYRFNQYIAAKLEHYPSEKTTAANNSTLNLKLSMDEHERQLGIKTPS